MLTQTASITDVFEIFAHYLLIMITYIVSQVRDFTSSNSWLSRAAMCKCIHFTFHTFTAPSSKFLDFISSFYPAQKLLCLCLVFFFPAQKLPFQSQCWSSWSVGSLLPPASQLSGLLFMQSSRTSVYKWCPCQRAHSSCNQTTSAWCPCQGARSLPSCHPACVHHLRGIPSWGSLCKRELQPQQQVELAQPFWTSCI